MVSPNSHASLLEALVASLPGLPEPRSYYSGKGGAPSDLLPGNIICFKRQSALSLGEKRSRAIHHRFVLIFAIRGEGTVCVDAANLRLRPGTALLILPYQYHFYSDIDESIRWLFVTFEAPPGRWLEAGNVTHVLGEMEIVLFRELVECWGERRRHTLLSWHLALLLERIRFLPLHKLPDPEPEADLLVKVNQYALQHLDRIIPLSELASVIGLSESHLRAEFRQLTGKPLGRHLRYLRLQRACALLDTTTKNVSEIAQECGFDSLFSFSRAFKASYEISPSAYRRRGQF